MALCNVLNLIPCQIPSNIVTAFPPSITLLKQQGTEHPYLSCQARALRSCCCCASVQSVSDAGITQEGVLRRLYKEFEGTLITSYLCSR